MQITKAIFLLLLSALIVGFVVVQMQDIVARERLEVWEMCNTLDKK